MGARGRKPGAAANVVPIQQVGDPLAPPCSLSKAEAAEWRAIVASVPADWFQREHQAVLEAYCVHSCRFRTLRAVLNQMDDAGLKPEDAKTYDQLSKSAERESRAMIAAARTLRLTHQSQYDAQKAHRNSKRPTGIAPWQFGK
jgi:hypothetical protein